MSRLTDLEGAALAEFAKRGPTTSYAVTRTFRESPSEFWSGSAGAVYPMVRRLEKRGLLKSETAEQGRRERKDYSITHLGKAALEQWLLDGERAAGLGFDPLRTRLIYLDLVTPAQRDGLLDDVRARHREAASKKVWVDFPLGRKVHESWMTSRTLWLNALDFIKNSSPKQPPQGK
jgi:DNA-binding PadR family transcriptional regulator